MSRSTAETKLVEIYSIVSKHPGKKAGAIASLLGVSRSEVTRALPALETAGLLIYEDEYGGLYPYPDQEKEP